MNAAAQAFEDLTGRVLPTPEQVAAWSANTVAEIYLGTWDAAANNPPLNAATPVPAGRYYRVTTPGTSSITGVPETFGFGDQLISRGNKYDRIAYSNLGYASIQDGPLLLAWVDDAGWCAKAIIDANLEWPPSHLKPIAFSAAYADILGAPSSPIETLPSDFLTATEDAAGITISALTADGLIWPPQDNFVIFSQIGDFAISWEDFNGWCFRATTESGVEWPPVSLNFPALASIAKTGKYSDLSGVPLKRWPNRYTNVYRKLPNFSRKMLGEVGKTAENPVRIIMYGDSIFAREAGTTIGPVNPSAYPPTVETNQFSAYLYRSLGKTIERPNYARFDSGRFTEAGTFTTLLNSASWDDGSRIARTRTSASAGAVVGFTVPVGKKYFNWIDRTATNGPTSVTIGVTGGNGILLVKLPGSTNWVEANGATFSQREVDEGARRGNTIYQRRIYFKKVSDVAVDVTITKDGTSDVFMYWGLEEVTGNNPYVQLINNARAGHKIADLYAFWDDDIVDQKPDLVLFEIPIINMYIGSDSKGAQFSKEYCVNWTWDAIWGDRPGAENTWNLKTASNNWADFEVLAVIPHISRQSGVATYINPDGSWIVNSAGNTAPEVWNAIKALFVQKGDVAFIDMMSVFFEECDKEFGGNYYTAISASSSVGDTYTDDNTHINNKSTLFYAENICPVFSINTL